MKMIKIFLIIPLFIFSGCKSDEELRELKLSYFKDGVNLVCCRVQNRGRYFTTYHDRVLIDNTSHFLIDNDRYLVDNNLTTKPYYIDNCDLVQEKETFKLDDGKYLLLDGEVKKIKDEV